MATCCKSNRRVQQHAVAVVCPEQKPDAQVTANLDQRNADAVDVSGYKSDGMGLHQGPRWRRLLRRRRRPNIDGHRRTTGAEAGHSQFHQQPLKLHDVAAVQSQVLHAAAAH